MWVKKTIGLVTLVFVLVACAVTYYNSNISRTRIAFVNYQAISLGEITRANDNSMVKIEELSVENLEKLRGYDMVFVNGMGLRLTTDQRGELVKAAEDGTPVLTSATTNPMNQIVSVDSIDYEYLKQYLTGGRSNYRNMLRYVRKFIDGKTFFVDEPDDPVLKETALLYYPLDGDDALFGSVAEYEAWLKKKGKWREGVPHIILTGSMGVPDSLISALERTGNIVYPVKVLPFLIATGSADSICVSAVINMAHGRMGDNVVQWLAEKNIPLFAPLNANTGYNVWMADKMGMSGGFMSQSIVTPEIDGAIRPFTLFAQFNGSDGVPYVAAIPGRLDEFVATVNNHITLQTKPNSDKKIAIFYFKGPGQSSLVAEGMDVVPSLYNLLVELKNRGYRVENLPAKVSAFEKLISLNGRVFNDYAAGAMADFVKVADPQIICREDYENWVADALSPDMLNDIVAVDGAFPGHGPTDSEGRMALARIDLGNVVLIPQPAAGLGDYDFQMVHGTDAAPPHRYVAAYLWAQKAFGADAVIHFGAHGSLEFTPRKQVALGSADWCDRLIGSMPHIYAYSTSNVGEAMTAKRRSYAEIVNYLTPPFVESNVQEIYGNLTDAIQRYRNASTLVDSLQTAREVKELTLKLGINRELRIDSVKPFSEEVINRVERFAEEIVNQRITGALYVMGEPYTPDNILSTVEAMTVDPIAYSLHKLNGSDIAANRERAKRHVRNGGAIDDATICCFAGIGQGALDSARRVIMAMDGGKDMLSRMMVMGAMMPRGQSEPLKIADRPATKRHHGMIPGMSAETALEMAKKMGANDEQLKKMEAGMNRKNVAPTAVANDDGKSGNKPSVGSRELSAAEIEFAMAVIEVEKSLKNIELYRHALQESPRKELESILNALNGGYVVPSSGGDPVVNPDILPTGRNMYAINAEETPSVTAWENGKVLADNTIKMYREVHGDSLPRKVSYTLWSSEFIETEGATIAQVLYMLGVEPVRDPFGRVTDLQLIPSAELSRPRIDVVVQTSGQLRDLAASRLFLINRAVNMAASAQNDVYPNYVAEGAVASEKHLVDCGVSPREARELSTARVFGGVGGNYGSGIQGMVESGDKWDNASEIASVYIKNMGATYGSEENWEMMREFVFESALTGTDVVIQPRQSNTWGALSLDHVYEFMGGMNLAIKSVTGKEPDAYLSDYRNRSNARMQELKEAIGVESRTTILNPSYIKAKMQGGAGDAASIADVVRNTYGWNVMKPDVIDNELWDGIYDTYVADIHNLGTQRYFRDVNPAAMQEMTGVMLETARKGMWNATPDQLEQLARVHTELIDEYGAACTGFVCDNAKLREFISSHLSSLAVTKYQCEIARVRGEMVSDSDGVVMRREELDVTASTTTIVSGVVVALAVLLSMVGLVVLVKRRRRK